MNEVFLIGKVICDVDFTFILNSKSKKSIAKFKIKSNDDQYIDIVAYNENADYCYRNIKKNYKIFIYGFLEKNSVIIKNIIIL